MKVEISKTFSIRAPVSKVWGLMTDVKKVSACIPGAQYEQDMGENKHSVMMVVKVGPIKSSYRGEVSIRSIDEEKHIIESLEKSADVTLKFNHDLGEVLGLKPAAMAKTTKQEVEKFTKIAKKDFPSLSKKYGLMCKNLVENQKQRIDYWEKEGNKKIK